MFNIFGIMEKYNSFLNSFYMFINKFKYDLFKVSCRSNLLLEIGYIPND